jgi:O-antigen/teichoic acid export membrane protein
MNRLVTIVINTVRGFSNPLFNFLIVIFGVRIFGKTDWASLINIMLWIFFISFVLGWGNRDFLLRKYSQEPGKMYSAFFSNLISRSLLLPISLILFLFYPIQIAFWAILLVVLIFCYSSLSTLVVYHQKFRAQLTAEIIGFVIIIGNIFYLETFELETFLTIYTLAITVKLCVLSLQLKFWKEPFTAKISIQEFKNGFQFFVLGFSGWIFSKIDIYVVDFYMEKSQLAEYQLLITAFLMLQALAAYITIPFTKHVYRVTSKVLKKMKYKLYLAALPLTLFGGFAIWFIMEYFVELGFSYEYYMVGCLIALPCYFYTINIMELMKNHKERIIIYISLIGLLVNITLIYFLIETHEIFGVLLSVCITQWVVLIIYKTYLKTRTKNQLYL